MSLKERKLFEAAMQAQASLQFKPQYFNVNADGAYINMPIEAGFQGWLVARQYHASTKLVPFSVDRTHPNQAFVTLGFDSVEDCTNFIKTIS